jgi:hypothetical protein
VRAFLIALASALVLSGCAMPKTATPETQRDWGHLSLQLKRGMTEQDVINLLGEPAHSSLDTCGGATGRPWGCKVWVYGLQNLRIYFHESQPNTWLVDSWTSV